MGVKPCSTGHVQPVAAPRLTEGPFGRAGEPRAAG